MEILKEIVPTLSRLAIFGTSKYPGNQQALTEVELAATAFKTQVQFMDILSAKDLDAAFKAVVKGRADAVLLMVPSGVVNFLRKEITDLAVKHRLPATYQQSEYVEVGGLMSYGASIDDLNRRAATYVDKILRGAKPGDLPVEQPTKFELMINLKAATQIGLTIRPNVLAGADHVIK